MINKSNINYNIRSVHHDILSDDVYVASYEFNGKYLKSSPDLFKLCFFILINFNYHHT